MHIVTDSTCDLTLKEAQALGISMLSLKVHFGTETYRDKIDLTGEEFFKKLAGSAQMPTTSMLTSEDFLKVFEKHPDEEILVITISSLLSGTCQSAFVAKAHSGRDDVYVVDSGSTTIGLALLVKEAVRLREEGMSAQEISETLERIKPRLRIYAMIDTLKYLVKGGRLSGAQGAIGTILALKPIISVRNGQVLSIDRARGARAAMRKLLDLLQMEPMDANLPHAYAHGGNRDTLMAFMHAVGMEAPDSYLGSVVGAHAGPGAVAVAYFISE